MNCHNSWRVIFLMCFYTRLVMSRCSWLLASQLLWNPVTMFLLSELDHQYVMLVLYTTYYLMFSISMWECVVVLGVATLTLYAHVVPICTFKAIYILSVVLSWSHETHSVAECLIVSAVETSYLFLLKSYLVTWNSFGLRSCLPVYFRSVISLSDQNVSIWYYFYVCL